MIAITGPADEEPDDRVAKTKRQIQALVKEIAQLAESEIPVPEFFAGFLPRVVAALAAPAGAIWRHDRGSNFKVVDEVWLRERGLPGDTEQVMSHAELLRAVMENGCGEIIRPGERFGSSALVNPTTHLLIFAPLRFGPMDRGLVEVFQRPVDGLNTRRGYLRFLRQMCELADAFLRKHPS